jgi:hypothetical protein
LVKLFLLTKKSNTNNDNKHTKKSPASLKNSSTVKGSLMAKVFAIRNTTNSSELITTKCMGLDLLKKLEIIYNVCIFAV